MNIVMGAVNAVCFQDEWPTLNLLLYVEEPSESIQNAKWLQAISIAWKPLMTKRRIYIFQKVQHTMTIIVYHYSYSIASITLLHFWLKL